MHLFISSLIIIYSIYYFMSIIIMYLFIHLIWSIGMRTEWMNGLSVPDLRAADSQSTNASQEFIAALKIRIPRLIHPARKYCSI